MNQKSAASSRLHYAWIVAGVTFLVLLATAAVRATPGILIVPFQQEFGWSNAAISSAIAINIALFGLIGPFAASFMGRYGVRRIVLLALTLLAFAVALSSTMHYRWQLMLFWGFLVGVGTGVAALVLAAVVVNRWFDQRRGLVLGILTAANATGQLVFLPNLARLVTNHGWRSAVYTVAACVAVVFLVVLVWMKDHPSDVGLLPYGASTEAQTSNAVRTTSSARSSMGGEVAGILDSRGQFLRLRCQHQWTHRHAPDSRVHGPWNPGSKSRWTARCNGHLRSRRNHVFRLANRSLQQPVPAFLLLRIAGTLAALSAIRAGAPDKLAILLRGLLWSRLDRHGAANRSAYGECLWPRKLGVVYGWIGAAHMVGASLAALAAGSIRTYLGDYRDAFWLSGGLCLMAATLLIAERSGKPARATHRRSNADRLSKVIRPTPVHTRANTYNEAPVAVPSSACFTEGICCLPLKKELPEDGFTVRSGSRDYDQPNR